MKKNTRIIIFSLIGIIVLGAVTAILLLTAPTDETESDTATDTVDTTVTLVEKTTAELTKLTVTNDEGTYDILPNGTDTDGCILWTIEDVATAPLVQATFESAVKNAVSLSSSTVVEENVTDMAKYGLDEPVAVYTAHFADGTSFTLNIGNSVPNSATKTYISPADSTTVYIGSSSALGYFEYSKFDFINCQLLEAVSSENSPEISKLTVERADLEKPIVIEMLPEAEEGDLNVFSYGLTSPYDIYLDLNNGTTYLYGLYGLTASEACWVGMEESDYALSGLDNPLCTVTMLVNGKTYTLKVGAPIGTKSTSESGAETTSITGYYAMFSEIPDVLYILDASTFPYMTMQASDCMSKLFLMPYINTLDKIIYKDSTQTLEFDLSYIAPETEDGNGTNEVYLGGEKLDIDRFKTLYQFMISARGEDIYTDAERGDFIASLTYVYNDTSKTSDVVEFYASANDRKTVISLNGSNLFKVRQMFSTRLVENVAAFLSGGDIELNY